MLHIATHLSHLNPLYHLRAFAVAGEYTEVLVVQPIRWDIYGGDPLSLEVVHKTLQTNLTSLLMRLFPSFVF